MNNFNKFKSFLPVCSLGFSRFQIFPFTHPSLCRVSLSVPVFAPFTHSIACHAMYKVKVRSPDEGTDYFDIVEGVLQGDTLAPYLFIICLDYVLRTSIDLMKENSFKLAKERRCPAKTIAGADYADDIGGHICYKC